MPGTHDFYIFLAQSVHPHNETWNLFVWLFLLSLLLIMTTLLEKNVVYNLHIMRSKNFKRNTIACATLRKDPFLMSLDKRGPALTVQA
jgi:hypothetical protein